MRLLLEVTWLTFCC